MSESAPRVVADHRNGRISIVVERRRARHSRLRGVGLCDRGASAPRQQRGGGVTHAARPVSPPSRPRRAGPVELPTRCLYDNEGRSASAVRSQPACGCSTPNARFYVKGDSLFADFREVIDRPPGCAVGRESGVPLVVGRCCRGSDRRRRRRSGVRRGPPGGGVGPVWSCDPGGGSSLLVAAGRRMARTDCDRAL